VPAAPRVSALIVSYNTRALTLEAVASVAEKPDIETIVVDNASSDHSAEAIAARFPSVRVIRLETNLGFAGGVNRAAAAAVGQALLVLNSDARLEPRALNQLLEVLEHHPRAALAAPALRYPDGRAQASAFKFPGLMQVLLDLFPVDRLMDSGINGRIESKRPVVIDHPLGACMLIRGSAWKSVGPFDEGYFIYLEEVDWCRRARQRGWQIWYQPAAVAIHHGGSSTRQQHDFMFAQLWRSRLRYYVRFHGLVYNRLIHALVRVGLKRSSSSRVETVCQLVK
jgi:GT2 family glycosyltransferase